ncbi:MAG TPA: DUF6036 family nucleotidyltransferase [Galbitalea sp.]|jgi:hypothetical protein|nr:DUF6036 family nucleotidyltransferase [Galbitalea sp.]
MNRRQLEEAIARACEIVGQPRVIVVGSQAILASYDFEQLPRTATMSMEADIAPEKDIDDYLSSRLWVLAGQDSEWANERDYFIDAVSANTAILPDSWRERSIEVAVPESAGFSGLCPEAHDLCASKMARGEPKDREFVQALSEAGLVNPHLLRNRLDEISDPRLEPDRKRASRKFVIWLEEERRRARTP